MANKFQKLAGIGLLTAMAVLPHAQIKHAAKERAEKDKQEMVQKKQHLNEAKVENRKKQQKRQEELQKITPQVLTIMDSIITDYSTAREKEFKKFQKRMNTFFTPKEKQEIEENYAGEGYYNLSDNPKLENKVAQHDSIVREFYRKWPDSKSINDKVDNITIEPELLIQGSAQNLDYYDISMFFGDNTKDENAQLFREVVNLYYLNRLIAHDYGYGDIHYYHEGNEAYWTLPKTGTGIDFDNPFVKPYAKNIKALLNQFTNQQTAQQSNKSTKFKAAKRQTLKKYNQQQNNIKLAYDQRRK